MTSKAWSLISCAPSKSGLLARIACVNDTWLCCYCPVDGAEYTLYIFSAFQGFCSKAFHPYLREPSRRSSEIDEETLVSCPPTWNLFHHPDILLRKHWIQWDCFYWVNRIAQWPLNASLECKTRPSVMKVSPKTFGLSKSLHVDGEQTNSISQVFTML